MQSETPSLKISSPWRVILPISLGTGLSLMGDSSLYTVLATHAQEAGVLLASVGILLSANRWVRLPLNSPAGYVIEKIPRKPVFTLALFLGAISTFLYAISSEFTPLLAGRLLWGIAWVGIWVGGNTMVLDISQANSRGKWVGIYQISFFSGAGGGALLGGLMTDWIGYHNAMFVNAALTLLGAIIALIVLPETRGLRRREQKNNQGLPDEPQKNEKQKVSEIILPDVSLGRGKGSRAELASATALLAVNRLAVPGILIPTFGLFLQQTFGDSFQIMGIFIGIATLTGLALGLNTLISTITTPIVGGQSDRASSRWRVAANGLLPGIVGFGLLTSKFTALIIIGLILISITSGSNTNLSTALIGDLGIQGQHGRRLGILFTIGDLTSAIGPPLAFWLLPFIQISGVYWLAAAAFVMMWLTARKWAAQ